MLDDLLRARKCSLQCITKLVELKPEYSYEELACIGGG